MDSYNNNGFNLKEKATGFYQNHPVLSHVILILLTGFFLALIALLFLNIWTEHGKTSVTPDIKGLQFNEAKNIIDAAGMEIEISDSIYDSGSKPGTIMESWPRANTTVKPGRKVFVTINAFSPRKVTIGTPIQDISSRQAVAYLEGLGIKSVKIEYRPGEFDDLVKGAYLDGKQLIPGSTLPITSTVTVVVTKAQNDESRADSIFENFHTADDIIQ